MLVSLLNLIKGLKMSVELDMLLKQQLEIQNKIAELADKERENTITEIKQKITLFKIKSNELFNKTGKEKTDPLEAAKKAFSEGKKVTKFVSEAGVAKYHYDGKKGQQPRGDGVVVKSIDEIV